MRKTWESIMGGKQKGVVLRLCVDVDTLFSCPNIRQNTIIPPPPKAWGTCCSGSNAAHVFSRLWHNYIEKSFIFSLCLVALAPHYLFWERPRECVQKVTTSHRILQTLLSLRHPAFLKRKYAADHWTFVNKFQAAFFVCVSIQIACLKILGLLGLGLVSVGHLGGWLDKTVKS